MDPIAQVEKETNENEWDWSWCAWYGELTITDKRTQPTRLIIITQQRHNQNNSKNMPRTQTQIWGWHSTNEVGHGWASSETRSTERRDSSTASGTTELPLSWTASSISVYRQTHPNNWTRWSREWTSRGSLDRTESIPIEEIVLSYT